MKYGYPLVSTDNQNQALSGRQFVSKCPLLAVVKAEALRHAIVILCLRVLQSLNTPCNLQAKVRV